MKLSNILSIIVLLLIWQACSSSDKVREDQASTVTEERNIGEIKNTGSHELRELSDYLVQISGVSVTGTGAGTQVRIRGTSSFLGGNEPLYVMDGRIMGQSYSSVSFLRGIDIDSVRVLKGTDASAYGSRGANGVVIIATKK